MPQVSRRTLLKSAGGVPLLSGASAFKAHSTGATVRPTVWPTPILNEGDSLAFDILAVASPDPGGDLTVGFRLD